MAVDKQLINYISQNLQMGYDQQAITQALLSSGYSQKQVNAAFDYLYAQSHYTQGQSQYTQSSHTSRSFFTSPIGLAFSVLGFILFGMLAVVFFSSNEPQDSFVITNPVPQPSQPSQQLERPQTQNESDDEPAPTQQPQVNDSQQQPVQPSPSQPRESQNQQSRPQQPQTTTNLQSSNPTRAEIDAAVNQIAQNRPDDAISLCSQITTRSGRSSCYTRVSIASQQPRYCEEVEDLFSRDNCYMQFAIEEIGTLELVCPNISDRFTQRSCTLLYQNFVEKDFFEEIKVHEQTFGQNGENEIGVNVTQDDIDEFYTSDVDPFR